VSKPVKNVEVNETLSINWEDPNPRVLWDGGSPIGEFELRILWPLCHRLSLQRFDGENHAGTCGFFTGLRKPTLSGMIDIVKGIEPETGYAPSFKFPKRKRRCGNIASARPRQFARTAAWVAALTFGQRSPYSQDRSEHGPANGISNLRKRQVRLGPHQ